MHTSPGFLGFDVANPGRAGRVECFRAIEESAAYVSLAHLRIIEELTGQTVRDGVLTGGAAKGQLWPQIVADTLGIPLRIPVVEESTALGAAICAGVGAGFWKGTTRGRAVAGARPHGRARARSACHLPGFGRNGSRSTAARWRSWSPGLLSRSGAPPGPD